MKKILNHGVTRRKNNFRTKTSVVFFLFSFLAFLSCNGVPEDPLTVKPETWEDARPLQDLYANDFLMGNIISTGDINNATRFGYLKRHFNTVTAENQMKPNDIAPSSKPAVGAGWNYRFTNADKIVAAARAEGMAVVGHTLIWHSQTPTWLTADDAATVEANLDKYVTEVVTHFKDMLISWDVVNEAMRDGTITTSDAADWKGCLRPVAGNGWLKIGPEYIEKAFLAARAADPDVQLYYNDFNLNNAGKALAVYNMVNDINTRHSNVGGRPLIDGIGMQSHHRLLTDPLSVDASIKLFASLGVEIAISELDIIATDNLPNPEPNKPWSPLSDATIAQKQAAHYAAMFKIFLNNAADIERVTFWGIDDGTSWRGFSHPTLLNADYSLKPAFYAVMNPYGGF